MLAKDRIMLLGSPRLALDGDVGPQPLTLGVLLKPLVKCIEDLRKAFRRQNRDN